MSYVNGLRSCICKQIRHSSEVTWSLLVKAAIILRLFFPDRNNPHGRYTKLLTDKSLLTLSSDFSAIRPTTDCHLSFLTVDGLQVRRKIDSLHISSL